MPSAAGRRKGTTVYKPTVIDRASLAKEVGIDADTEPDVFAFYCKALEEPLPEPWTEHADRKKRVFYWNPASRHSTWQHPLAPMHRALVDAYRRIKEAEDPTAAVMAEVEAYRAQVEDELSHWRQSHAPDGTEYYYKVGTQLTRWDNPRGELIKHMELQYRLLSSILETPTPREEEQEQLEDELQATEDTAMAPTELIATSDGELHEGPGWAASSAPVEEQEKRGRGKREKKGSSRRSSPGLSSGEEGKRGFLSRFGGILPCFRKPATPGTPDDEEPKELGEVEPADPRAVPMAATPKPKAKSKKNIAVDEADLPTDTPKSGGNKTARRKRKEREEQERRERAEWNRRNKASKKIQDAARRRLAVKVEAAVAIQRATRRYLVERDFKLAKAGEFSATDRRVPPGLRELLPVPPPPLPVPAAPRLKSHPTSPIRADLPTRIVFKEVHQKALPGRPDGESLHGCVIPDEIALYLGVRFDDALDRNAFAIMKPLFLQPLPAPWQILRHSHGRFDFFHPSFREYRQRHPLFQFYSEVLEFLREHAATDMPITEPLRAKVFDEASPDSVRSRLGIWVGPKEESGPIGPRYQLLYPGKDEACPEGDERLDDPRLEATANVFARLWGWHHLWIGFAPEEPFPFLEDKLAALAAQLSEGVLVSAGAAAEKALAHMRRQEWPPMREMSPDEEAIQARVIELLGAAYGKALNVVGEKQSWDLLPPSVQAARTARVVLSGIYAFVDRNIPEPEAEEEYSEDPLSAEEFDEFDEEEEEESEDYDEEEVTSTEDEEEWVQRSSPPRTPAGVSAPPLVSEPLEDPHKAEDAELDPDLLPPMDTRPFLLELERDPSDWATEQLRPLTPPAGSKQEPPQETPRMQLPARSRPKHVHDQKIWSDEMMVLTTVVKPWINELGWRCSRQILDNMLQAIFEEPVEAVQHVEPGAAIVHDGFRATADPVPAPASSTARTARGQHSSQRPRLLDTDLPEPTPTMADAAQGPLINTTLATTVAKTPKSAKPLLSPTALRAARSASRAEVDAFARALAQSADNYAHATSASGSRPETPAWQFIASLLPDSTQPSRQALVQPDMPFRSRAKFAEMEEDDSLRDGYVATAVTPQGVDLPVPPYLRGAQLNLSLAVGRPGSAGPVLRGRNRERRHLSQRSFELAPRPESAESKVRKPMSGLTTKKKDIAAEMQAQNVIRFLNRRYGTLQGAFEAIDKNGNGFVDRQEWECGVREAGYTEAYDLQEIFTALDKRQHHVITLSDILERRGVHICDGVPPPGLEGLVSDLLFEVIADASGSIVDEVLRELLQEELLGPRGPQDELPDVKKWLRKQEQRAKKLKKQQEAAAKAAAAVAAAETAHHEDGSLSPTSDASPTRPGIGESGSISPAGKKKKPRKGGKKKFRAIAAMAGSLGRRSASASSHGSQSRRSSPASPSSRSRDPSRGKTNLRKMRRAGMLAALASKDGESFPSENEDHDIGGRPSSRFKATGRAAMIGRRSSPGQTGRPTRDSSRSTHRDGQATRGGGRSMRGASRSSHTSGRPTPGNYQEGFDEEVDSTDKSRNDVRRAGSASNGRYKATDRFSGYEFADKELEAVQKEKLLPWAPRPTDEVLKTYGHIFRLLRDPKVQGQRAKPKRSVHVSMPKLPSASPPEDDAGSELLFGGHVQEDSLDVDTDQVPAFGSKGKGTMRNSRSSPNLSKISTTPGSTWHMGSLESASTSSPGNTGSLKFTALPALPKKTGPSRVHLGRTRPRSGIDDEIRRGPTILGR